MLTDAMEVHNMFIFMLRSVIYFYCHGHNVGLYKTIAEFGPVLFLALFVFEQTSAALSLAIFNSAAPYLIIYTSEHVW